MDSKKIGNFISELRKNLGLTQIALAEKLNVSNRAVSKWENGDGFPDVTMLPTLAETLGVSVDELLAGEKKVSDRPDALFVNKFYLDKDSFISVIKKYLRIRHPNYLFITELIFFTVLFVTGINFSPDLKNTIIPLYGGLTVLLFFLQFILPIITGKIEFNDVKKINEDLFVIYEFSDKIYVNTGSEVSNYSYNSITKLEESNDLFILFLGKGHFIYLRKDSFATGDADDFRQFIVGKFKTIKYYKRRRRYSILGACLMITMSVTLIPLNIIYSFMKSDNYQNAFIEMKQENFETNKAEFERAVTRVRADKTILEEIEKDSFSFQDAEGFIAVSEVVYIDIGENAVTFEMNDNSSSDCGIVYYEGKSLPYPYQIGFGHSDLDNESFNYISEDDLYILGKENNDNEPALNGWYLIKPFDDNWYYYEYY